jgi:hypothetical protein
MKVSELPVRTGDGTLCCHVVHGSLAVHVAGCILHKHAHCNLGKGLFCNWSIVPGMSRAGTNWDFRERWHPDDDGSSAGGGGKGGWLSIVLLVVVPPSVSEFLK